MKKTTRKALLSGTSAVIVLALCVAYLLGPILQTGRGGSTVDVQVHLPRSGGIFEGASVSYRGVVVGKITDLSLDQDGLVAVARITAPVDIPVDSEVRVRTLSAVGEQYLDFAPRTSQGPFLDSGDEISADAQDIPESVGEVALSLDKLATQFDPATVQRVLHAAAVGLYGAEDELQRLIRDGQGVITTVDDNLALIQRFLTSGRTVLQIGVDTGGDVRRATASFATFARWLRGFDPELFDILDRTPADLEQLRGLVIDLRAVLPDYLDSQSDVVDILTSRDPHVRTLLQVFPDGIDALASTINNQRVYFDLIARRGPNCRYSNIKERNPRDTTNRELQTGGHCPRTATSPQRGAQFAPGPTR